MRLLPPKDGFWVVRCAKCGDAFYWNKLFCSIKPTFHICDVCGGGQNG